MRKFILQKESLPVAYVYYFKEDQTGSFVSFIVVGPLLRYGHDVQIVENQEIGEYLKYIANINNVDFDNYIEI